jgi:hypothetical protein
MAIDFCLLLTWRSVDPLIAASHTTWGHFVLGSRLIKKKTFSTITTGAVFKTQMVSQKPCHSMLVGSVFGIPFFDA